MGSRASAGLCTQAAGRLGPTRNRGNLGVDAAEDPVHGRADIGHDTDDKQADEPSEDGVFNQVLTTVIGRFRNQLLAPSP